MYSHYHSPVLEHALLPSLHICDFCWRAFKMYIYKHTHTHTHTHIWFNGRSQYKNSSALEKCIGIYLFQEIEGVLVVIDPFKKPHGFKTGEFGWSAKCYINNRVLSMIMSTNEKLYLQSLDWPLLSLG